MTSQSRLLCTKSYRRIPPVLPHREVPVRAEHSYCMYCYLSFRQNFRQVATSPQFHLTPPFRSVPRRCDRSRLVCTESYRRIPRLAVTRETSTLRDTSYYTLTSRTDKTFKSPPHLRSTPPSSIPSFRSVPIRCDRRRLVRTRSYRRIPDLAVPRGASTFRNS